MTVLERNTVRLRQGLLPATERKCGGACEGEAVEETIRQWIDGAWYDVVWVRCLNLTPLKPDARRRLREERSLKPYDKIKCNWRKELSRVARPDIPPPTLQTKAEVPTMLEKTSPAAAAPEQKPLSLSRLRGVLFQELDDLRSGESDPQRATAVSRLAAQIVNSVAVELQAVREIGGCATPL